MKYLVLSFVLLGCNIESKNRVIYEDKTPVQHARVQQWNADTELKTLTDANGTWIFHVPVGTEWDLCIEDPKDNNALCCYEGGILTIDETGELVDYE